MKKLLRFLKGYGVETVMGPLFKLLEACFELFVPLVVAAIIDVGIAGGDRSYVIGGCGIMIALGIIGLVCAITAQYFAAKAATGCSSELRKSLYTHIMKLSPSRRDELGTSTLITRMTSDVNQIQSGINLALRLLLRSPFIVIGSMVMAFTVDSRSALVFVAVIPLLSAVVFGIMLISIPLYKKIQARLDRVTMDTRENLNGVRVVRAFNREADEVRRFGEDNEQSYSLQMKAGRLSALMNPLTYVIINLGIILLIYTGALRVDSGAISQGELYALVNYMSQILVELIKFANLIISITKAIACGNRVQAIFDVPEGLQDGEVDAGSDTHEPFISFENVSLTYKGASAPTVQGIDLEVLRGQTVGIIGATGSGKTTVINLLMRLYDVTEGCIRIGGQDIRACDVSVLRERIGVVPQKAVLFRGTVRDNLRWGKADAKEDEMWDALRLAMADGFISKKEGGLDAEVQAHGNNFSGGQRQRLTVARALIRRPEILILDDSTSALDLATDAALRRNISALDYSPTVFIVSQRASSVRHADKILVLDDGEVVGLGSHDELIRSCPTYVEIYNSQFSDASV